MSAIRDYYEQHHSPLDELHKLLDKEPGIRAQLPPVRRAMLDCCGAEKSKSEKVELVVVDVMRWDQQSRELAAITAKLTAIDAMVAELDKIFTEIEATGLAVEPIANSIWNLEASRRVPVLHPDTGTTTDPWGRPVPQKRDSQLVAWGERIESALAEAQKIVG